MKSALKLCLVSILIFTDITTEAQTQRSGSDANRVLQQLQQVTAEKSKLQQDNESLKKELEAMKAKTTQTGGEQAKSQQLTRELELMRSRLQANTSETEQALEKSRTQLQELIGKYREMAQTLKEVETERDTLRADKTGQERAMAACVDKNAQMYLLGNEVLDQMDKQGMWSALKSKEPFTKMSRTRLENLIDDYRYRVDALKLSSKAASASP